MLVCLTGTPGTGKTSAGGLLAHRGCAVLPMDLVADHFGLAEGHDPVMVDEEGLGGLGPAGGLSLPRQLMALALGADASADPVPEPKGDRGVHLFVEGHLSHFLPPEAVDAVVVLRRHPRLLRPHLEGRGYSGGKVRENLEAECIDVIGQEAAGMHRTVVEFDGTDSTAEGLAEGVMRLVGSDPGIPGGGTDAHPGGGGQRNLEKGRERFTGCKDPPLPEGNRGEGPDEDLVVPPPRRPGEIDFSEAILEWY